MKTKKEPWMKQVKEQMDYQSKTHTEDCLDANDDTSVLKGRCICPKEQPHHTPTPWRIRTTKNGDIEIIDEKYNPIAKMVFYPDDLDRKTSEQIVRAVNAHEASIRLRNEAVHFIHTGKGLQFLQKAIQDYDTSAKAEGDHSHDILP